MNQHNRLQHNAGKKKVTHWQTDPTTLHQGSLLTWRCFFVWPVCWTRPSTRLLPRSSLRLILHTEESPSSHRGASTLLSQGCLSPRPPRTQGHAHYTHNTKVPVPITMHREKGNVEVCRVFCYTYVRYTEHHKNYPHPSTHSFGRFLKRVLSKARSQSPSFSYPRLARAFKSLGYTPGRLNHELWVVIDEKARAAVKMSKA